MKWIMGAEWAYNTIKCPFCGYKTWYDVTTIGMYKPIPKNCPQCNRRLEGADYEKSLEEMIKEFVWGKK